MAFDVLIVDDGAMIARVVRLSGVPVGEIHQASDGAAGLVAVRERWIDFVLLDVERGRTCVALEAPPTLFGAACAAGVGGSP